MANALKRIIVLLANPFLVILGSACNTAHRFGEDVKQTGHNIEDGTK